MAVGIWLLAFIVCFVLVAAISVYGTKEVSFEENLEASKAVAPKKGHGKNNKTKSGSDLVTAKKKVGKSKLNKPVTTPSNILTTAGSSADEKEGSIEDQAEVGFHFIGLVILYAYFIFFIIW